MDDPRDNMESRDGGQETAPPSGGIGPPSFAAIETPPLIGPVVFGFLVLAVAFFAYQILGGLISFLLFGLGAEGDIQGMRVVTVISQLLFLVLPALLLLGLQRWKVRDVLRLKMPRLLPLLSVIVAVIAMQYVVQAYVEVQQHVLRNYLLPDSLLPLLDEFEQLLEELYGKLLAMRSPTEALFVWVVVALTPGFCEEVLFRGTVQYSFERGMRVRWALLLNGVIFSLFHLNPVTFVPLTMLGVFFAVITWRSGSIGYAVVAHITNNTLAVVALYVFQSDTLLPAESAGATPSAGVLLISGGIGLLVFAASVALFWVLTADRETETLNAL